MCGGLRVHRVKVRPGDSIKYRTISGERTGIWGIRTGMGAYNARVENLDKTWKSMKERRAVVEVDTFDEKGAEFRARGQERTSLAAMYDIDGAVVIITMDAYPEVKPIHHRMPVPLMDSAVDMWLDDGNLCPVSSVEMTVAQPVTNNHQSFLKRVEQKLKAR